MTTRAYEVAHGILTEHFIAAFLSQLIGFIKEFEHFSAQRSKAIQISPINHIRFLQVALTDGVCCG